LPSSSSVKKDASKSSSQRPIQKYVSEPESIADQAVVVKPEFKTPRKNKKKSVTATNAKKTKQLEQEIKTRLEAELRPILESELRPILEAELKTKLESEIKSSLEAELKPSLEHKLKTRLTAELKPVLEAELKTKLEGEVKSSLEAELKPSLEHKLKTRLETELRPKLEAELKTKLEAELKPKLGGHILSTINPQSEIKIQTESKSKNTIEFDMDTKQIVEAILFAADKPLTAKLVQKVYPELEMPQLQEVQAAIDSIIEDYEPRAIGLKKLASGYSFQVKEGYSYWVSRVFEEKPPRYSRALLETISIIAYRQPVTRGDIEDIRGVSVSSNIIRTLLDREWVRVIAHKEVPGRPALYGTTKQFLDYFNLSSLDQLPTLEEIKDLDFSSENTVKSDAQEDTGAGHLNQEQESEKQTSENPQIIEPISETRH
jgi:segregation and condensation protein B